MSTRRIEPLIAQGKRHIQGHEKLDPDMSVACLSSAACEVLWIESIAILQS